ncbi:MAG: T9SS type A sorting domain-containing protein [Bacteroidales bacterium]|nr:T9SS type A sorting domain-containing protein [Bacteroidales bacterium]
MKQFLFLLLVLLVPTFAITVKAQQTQAEKPEVQRIHNGKQMGQLNPFEVLDTRIDKMKYWRQAAELGLTPIEPYHEVPMGIFKGSRINAKGVVREDSPDVPVTTENSTQSENSIFINPEDPDHVLQSNNSTQNPVGQLYGANYFFSMDFGQTWGGSVQGAGGGNSGDPTTAINLDGRQFVGYIHNNYGQGVSYSDNGTTWTPVLVANASGGGILDKNHMWIDNSPTSPYEGNLYNAWTDFYGPNDSDIEISRSTNAGVSWSPKVNISSAINAGSHNQGVNIQTGPNGEVYVVWAVYDGWPTDESVLGFAKSFDGGATYQPATRILSNIRGIRNTTAGKNHRVNSFPSMTVDISGGENNGNIYIVWANVGVPGTNQGSDVDVYMIKSTNQGQTWSTPIKVNQDPSGLGRKHYFPWISCDSETGTLSVVYYDDRNVGGNKCEVWCSNSFDGGDTWEDFRVSDVDFTPAPIGGLAGGYMGDYLGIAARGSKVYPVWTDNRTGTAMAYVSPYETNNLPRPSDLLGTITFETGEVQLSWQFESVPGFQYFIVYRDNFQITTTTSLSYTDMLPTYGVYKYKVTAMHDDGESTGPSTTLQWGDAHIAVDPEEIIENIPMQSTSTRYVTIENTGQLDLVFEVSGSTQPLRETKDYCIPSGNCSFGDGLTGFSMGDIMNMNNGCSSGAYGNFTSMSTEVQIGESYNVSMTTGYSDQYVTIWIDFNKNETFEANEMLLEGFNLENVGQVYTAQITIPDGVESGEARMRAKAEWLNVPTDPCSGMSYGETEDYTVNVSGWMFVTRETDTIAPGNNKIIEVNFDSNDLENGTYYGNVKVESNDPDMPEVNVPVTLNVGSGFPLALTVVANPPTICLGESTQLFANVTGGSGAYTYLWTSDPIGFTSTEANPVVNPQETTIYYVVVEDGENSINGMTTVFVNTVPEQAATPQGDNSVCVGTYQTVYSTEGAQGSSTYIWTLLPVNSGTIEGNGLTAIVTWDEAFTGEAQIVVQGVNSCGNGLNSEPFMVTMHTLPHVNLGGDMEVCANESVLLDAGNPGATYLWSTGETTQTIVVDTTGVGIGVADFWVQVTDGNGCENSDNISIEFKDCTGISDVSDKWSFNIYPNPNSGLFEVQLQTIRKQQVSISVNDTFGKKVFSNDQVTVSGISAVSVDLRHLSDGVYLLRINGEGINVVQKFIISK